MSKRYGRQQKRKAADKIKQLEADKLQLVSDMDLNTQTLELSKRIIQLVYSVNPNSVVFKTSRIDSGIYRHAQHDHSPTTFIPAKGNEPPKLTDLRCIDLYDLEVEINRPDFRDVVHFEVDLHSPRGEGSRSAYRISSEALKHQPVKLIVEELVRHLKNNRQET